MRMLNKGLQERSISQDKSYVLSMNPPPPTPSANAFAIYLEPCPDGWRTVIGIARVDTRSIPPHHIIQRTVFPQAC